MHNVKSRDGGNLEKSGEGQGGERSLKGEEGKWTSEADPEAEADERKPGGGNRRGRRRDTPNGCRKSQLKPRGGKLADSE